MTPHRRAPRARAHGWLSGLAIIFLVAAGPAAAQDSPETPETQAPTADDDAASDGSGLSQAERLAALRRAKAENLSPEQVSQGEARVLGLEQSRLPFSIFQQGFRGFRPVTGGMPSGSGFVLGGGYVRGLESEIVTFSADSRFSTRGFKQADVRLVFPTAQSSLPIRAFVNASYQDYPGLRFFGLGNDSQRSNRTFFGQKNLIVGGGITGESRWIDAGAQFDRLRIETGSANRSPSVEDIFPIVADPRLAPLFGRDTDYNIVGGFIRFNLLDFYGYPRVGVQLTVEGWRYDDRDLDVLNFSKIVGHLRGQIPLGHRSRRLAFQIRTSHSAADGGNAVPIYLMETLGGANTIRGYREYRFRDRRNLLVNVEYRWEIWTYLDFALFYDGGKVFRHGDDLNFSDLHSGYGGGMRIHAPGEVFVNVDLARSTEGFRLHIGSGLGF